MSRFWGSLQNRPPTHYLTRLTQNHKIMAIAIRPIPVLTGSTAERFEEMIESSKQTEYTSIPDSIRQAVRAMQERSRNVVIKMPKQ